MHYERNGIVVAYIVLMRLSLRNLLKTFYQSSWQFVFEKMLFVDWYFKTRCANVQSITWLINSAKKIVLDKLLCRSSFYIKTTTIIIFKPFGCHTTQQLTSSANEVQRTQSWFQKVLLRWRQVEVGALWHPTHGTNSRMIWQRRTTLRYK